MDRELEAKARRAGEDAPEVVPLVATTPTTTDVWAQKLWNLFAATSVLVPLLFFFAVGGFAGRLVVVFAWIAVTVMLDRLMTVLGLQEQYHPLLRLESQELAAYGAVMAVVAALW